MKDKILKKAAHFFLAVEELNDPEQEELRMNTCLGCPKFKSENATCAVCGCFLEVKTKLKTNRDGLLGGIIETHCPLGKWGDIEIANKYRELKGENPLEADELIQN